MKVVREVTPGMTAELESGDRPGEEIQRTLVVVVINRND
jgi:hypothetical protein